MSRSLVALIVVVLLLIGGIFFLAGRNTEKPLNRTDKAVSLENLSK